MKKRNSSIILFPCLLFRCFSICLACLLFPALSFAQQSFKMDSTPSAEPEVVTILDIFVEGNKHTKTDIILRELDFQVGDTLAVSDLSNRIQKNELKILNTGLFTTAHIYFKNWIGATGEVSLSIEVQEGWYIFPFPIAELADRNFNVWWETYDHSLRRLNLGVRFYHTNFTGRNDLLKAVVQVGFTKKYELVYTLPYFNRKRTLGMRLDFLHTREKEIGFNTIDNELIFSRNGETPLLRRFRVGAGMIYRRRLDFVHQFKLSYHHNIIHESVRQELNPDFFLNKNEQRYPEFSYRFSIDKRDIRPYPMGGFFFGATLQESGLGLSEDIHALYLGASLQQFFSLSQAWSVGLSLKGRAGLIRGKQPFYNSKALGYGDDFVRGYELYVVDGLDFILHKETLRYNLFNREINLGRYMRLESFKKMPLKLFLVIHNEFGYVNNPFYKKDNSLSNELLWGTGIGFDLILYYDKVVNFELSRNKLNEYGFFLHWAFSF